MFDGWKISTTVNWCDSFPGWRHSRYWYLVRGVVVNQQAIEAKFNEMFKGASEFSYWRKGYKDQQKGYAPKMADKDYLAGYAKSYEEGEKQCQK